MDYDLENPPIFELACIIAGIAIVGVTISSVCSIKDLNDFKEKISSNDNTILDDYLTDDFIKEYLKVSRYITCAKKIIYYLVNNNIESDLKKCNLHNHSYYTYDSYTSNEYTLEEIEDAVMYIDIENVISYLGKKNPYIDNNVLIDMLKTCNDYINYGYELDSNLRVILATSALSDIYNQKYDATDIKIDKSYYEKLAGSQNDAWKYFEEEIKNKTKNEDYRDINIKQLYELITTNLYTKETCDCLKSFNYCKEKNDELNQNMDKSLNYAKKIYKKN